MTEKSGYSRCLKRALKTSENYRKNQACIDKPKLHVIFIYDSEIRMCTKHTHFFKVQMKIKYTRMEKLSTNSLKETCIANGFTKWL